jgi:hypothetical protein
MLIFFDHLAYLTVSLPPAKPILENKIGENGRTTGAIISLRGFEPGLGQLARRKVDSGPDLDERWIGHGGIDCISILGTEHARPEGTIRGGFLGTVENKSRKR